MSTSDLGNSDQIALSSADRSKITAVRKIKKDAKTLHLRRRSKKIRLVNTHVFAALDSQGNLQIRCFSRTENLFQAPEDALVSNELYEAKAQEFADKILREQLPQLRLESSSTQLPSSQLLLPSTQFLQPAFDACPWSY